MKPTELLEPVIRRVPYADQVTDIDVTREPDALRFTWRGNRFWVEEGRTRIMVEEARNGCLAGSDIAILMEEVLKREPARPEPPVPEDRTGETSP